MKPGKSKYHKKNRPAATHKMNESNTGKIPEDISSFTLEELQKLYHELRVNVFLDIGKHKQAEDEMKRSEARFESLLKISQIRTDSIQELLDFALEEAIALTNSKIGYIYLYDETKKEFTLNTWSKDVMKECSVVEKQTVYQLEKTGIWGEAVRQARPIIINDFQAPHPLKKGYPEGHSSLHKFVTVPVFIDDRIVGVVGIANKETDYDNTDVRQLTLLMDLSWKIIERKRSEDALRESEEKYRTLIESADDVIVLTDLKGKHLLRNKAYYTSLGYEESEPVDPDGFAQVHPEDLPLLQNLMRELIGRGTLTSEYRVKNKLGEWIYRSAKSTVIRDKEGKPQMILAIIRDITERKKREDDLQKLNRTLKALSNSSQAMMLAQSESQYLEEVCKIVTEDCGHAMVWIGFAENDENKTVRPVANAGFEEGYLETLKLTWADTERGGGPTGIAIRTGKPSGCKNMLTDPQFKPWREEAIKRGYASSMVLPLMSGGKAFGAINIYSREPDPFSKDEVELLFELASDLAHGITAIRMHAAQTKSEEALARERANLQTMFDVVNVGMLLIDREGVVRRINDTVSRWIGKDFSECCCGQPGDILGCIHAISHLQGCGHTPYCSSCPIRATFESVFRNGESVHNVETESSLTVDGKVVHMWIEVSADPLVLNGQPHVILALNNITERKRAEKEIKSVARFPEENPNPVLRVSFEGTVLYANNASGILLETWQIRVGEPLPERWREIVRGVLRTKDNINREVECGDRIFNLFFVFIAQTEYVNIYGLDITDRKRAEEQLRETKDYLDKLLNYANAPIIVWNPDMKITLFNRAFEKLTGYTAEEVIGRELDILFPSENRKETIEHIARTAGGEYWETVEIPILRKDDEVRIALWNSANITASDSVTIVATIAQGQDITERKLAEEKLGETSDYLNKLLNYANAPVIVWNPDMRITLFNRAFEKLTGYSSEEVIGRELAMLFPPESKKQSLENIARTSGGEYWETVEISILRKEGEVRIALWNSANITASDGVTIVATIAQGQDITERKKAEEKLREANKELEQFAYVASHDLQEPLRSVNSFTELLERRYRDQLDERAKEYIGFIVDGASRMQRLIQDLLAFTKVDRMNMERSLINCNNIIDRVVANIKESIEETGAEISHDNLPVLYANETSLTQLFQNLIGNSVKFHKEGAPPRVHISAQRKDGEWLFSVKDNGIGINQKYFGKLFVIFQRLHGRQEYPGTGIGLAICKKIVESYGGRIWVESHEGEGSTFYFTFPL